MTGHRCGTGGGPFQWFHQYYRCPASNTCSGLNASEILTSRTPALNYPDYVPSRGIDGEETPEEAEADAEERTLMRAEPATPKRCCVDLPEGYKCNIDCQKRIQNSETALAVDTGFYFDFSVDPETGRPGGCSAFDAPDWRTSKVVDCPLNNYAPEGETLSSIVEDFADHQDTWIKEYLTAFDKMSRNGNENLVPGPEQWFDASCSFARVRGYGKVWNCE